MLAISSLMKGLVSAVHMSVIINITLTAKIFTSFSHTVCSLFFYGSFL